MLHVKNFGLAMGTTFAIGMFALVLIMMQGWGTDALPLLAGFYKGTELSLSGAVVAAIWGFFDGLFGGIIFAWLYNWFNMKCPSAKGKKK